MRPWLRLPSTCAVSGPSAPGGQPGAAAARPAPAAARPTVLPAAAAHSLLKKFPPVTDAMLEQPDPSDWLNWRRTLDGWGYSPLNQINRQNAHTLQLAWSTQMMPGRAEATPLVYRGVMYLPGPNGGVQALDAVTGEPLWSYKKDMESQEPPQAPNYTWDDFSWMRNLAIYGDKIYMATHDAHILALDARNGTVVWDTTVANYKQGYRYTSGPIIVKGKVVTGMTGCERFKNDTCFITAHDAGTGKELWRVSTVARPGEPGGDTWGNLPLTFRAGSDAWIPGSYDPKTNLIYYSTAQAKPWARVSRRTDGDALYTNSVLALDPDTGKIVWYHQLIPGETHDEDEAFESILVDHSGRSSLFKMGKLGILWELDRRTGKFIDAHDLGYQNVGYVDKKKGQLQYEAGKIPELDKPLEWCGNVRNWPSMAYHPETQAVYVPASGLSCGTSVYSLMEMVEGGGGRWYGEKDHEPACQSPQPVSGQRAVPGDGHQDGSRVVAPRDEAQLGVGRPHDRRGPRHHRRRRSLPVRRRCGDRQDAVSDATACARARVSHYLCGGGTAVPGGAGGRRPECDLRVRPAAGAAMSDRSAESRPSVITQQNAGE